MNLNFLNKVIGPKLAGLLHLAVLIVINGLLYKWIRDRPNTTEQILQIERSFDLAKDESEERNLEELERLKSAVDRWHNREKHLLIQAKAESIHKSAKEIIDSIESIKRTLIFETGGYDDYHQYVGPNEVNKVEKLMLGSWPNNKVGKGYPLKAQLDNYYAELIKSTPENIHTRFTKKVL